MRWFVSVVLAALAAAGVSIDPATQAAGGEAREGRWYVYQDADSKENHGEWTNWMPEEAGKMVKLSLTEKKNPASGASCIRVGIKWENPSWCGVAVSCLPDYWGEKASAAAYDLRKAKKLRFHARGERGGERIQVKVAITGDKPFGDSAKLPAATEWIALTKGWKQYELDLKGHDLKRVVTPFVFVANQEQNPGDITFFLDEIYMVLEGGK